MRLHDTGPCEFCGEPGELLQDPYDLEVHDVISVAYMCPDCYESRAVDDIW